MKAYVIALEAVQDEEMFARYRAKVIATMEPFGGKFLIRAGRLTVMEGSWPHERTAVIEFPSRAQAEGWYRSPAYQAILPLRTDATRSDLIIIDGAE
jgi:uncharacterized protein (DUF1330 family)